jgi:hypothetical protein
MYGAGRKAITIDGRRRAALELKKGVIDQHAAATL